MIPSYFPATWSSLYLGAHCPPWRVLESCIPQSSFLSVVQASILYFLFFSKAVLPPFHSAWMSVSSLYCVTLSLLLPLTPPEICSPFFTLTYGQPFSFTSVRHLVVLCVWALVFFSFPQPNPPPLFYPVLAPSDSIVAEVGFFASYFPLTVPDFSFSLTGPFPSLVSVLRFFSFHVLGLFKTSFGFPPLTFFKP